MDIFIVFVWLLFIILMILISSITTIMILSVLKKLLTKKQIIISKKPFILAFIFILSISCGYIIFKRNNFKIICPNEYHYLLTDKQIEIFKNRVKTKYYLPCIPMYVSVDYLDKNGYYSLFVNYGLYNYQFERNSDGLYEFRK